MSNATHKDAAENFLLVAADTDNTAQVALVFAGMAQAHATLHLADRQAAAVEQQRVANLLAAAKLILDSKNVKYGVLGVADWATDSDADVHEALATSSVWIALLGYDEAKRKGMTA